MLGFGWVVRRVKLRIGSFQIRKPSRTHRPRISTCNPSLTHRTIKSLRNPKRLTASNSRQTSPARDQKAGPTTSNQRDVRAAEVTLGPNIVTKASVSTEISLELNGVGKEVQTVPGVKKVELHVRFIVTLAGPHPPRTEVVVVDHGVRLVAAIVASASTASGPRLRLVVMQAITRSVRDPRGAESTSLAHVAQREV